MRDAHRRCLPQERMMDDRDQMAKTMGSLLALTESLLSGDKYEGEDGVKARALVKKIKTLLARSNAARSPG